MIFLDKKAGNECIIPWVEKEKGILSCTTVAISHKGFS